MAENDLTAQKSNVVSLADEERVKQVLVSSILGLWDVVNNLTQLKPSKRERYRVTIFGSARVKPGTFGYEETKRLAAALGGSRCRPREGHPDRPSGRGHPDVPPAGTPAPSR